MAAEWQTEPSPDLRVLQVSFDLLANPPRLTVPVHFVIGQNDPLVSAEIVKQLSVGIAGSTLTELADAGHMVHFDQPEAVRSIILTASARK